MSMWINNLPISLDYDEILFLNIYRYWNNIKKCINSGPIFTPDGWTLTISNITFAEGMATLMGLHQTSFLKTNDRQYINKYSVYVERWFHRAQILNMFLGFAEVGQRLRIFLFLLTNRYPLSLFINDDEIQKDRQKTILELHQNVLNHDPINPKPFEKNLYSFAPDRLLPVLIDDGF